AHRLEEGCTQRRLPQSKKTPERFVDQRDPPVGVDREQTVLHCGKNRLGPGRALADLLIEFLMTIAKAPQRQANATRLRAAVDKKCARILTVTDLPNEPFDLPP